MHQMKSWTKYSLNILTDSHTIVVEKLVLLKSPLVLKHRPGSSDPVTTRPCDRCVWTEWKALGCRCLGIDHS